MRGRQDIHNTHIKIIDQERNSHILPHHTRKGSRQLRCYVSRRGRRPHYRKSRVRGRRNPPRPWLELV